jgi:antitoxin (DNA-binding transcriptional repressor) of toxin-antitoxin stability system
MHSLNIRGLRDTNRLKSWLRAGKTVELRERDRVIAHIVPENQEEKPVKWPDARKYSETESCREPTLSLKSVDAIDRLCGHQFMRPALRARPPLAGRRRTAKFRQPVSPYASSCLQGAELLTCGTMCATFSHAVG